MGRLQSMTQALKAIPCLDQVSLKLMSRNPSCLTMDSMNGNDRPCFELGIRF